MTRSATLLDIDGLTALLLQARGGSSESLGRLLEAFRNYLVLVARQELRGSLQAKMDAADLVQETFSEATRDFPHFRGETPAQLLGWLRGILRHNLTDLTRRYATGCRCLAHEVRLTGPFAPIRRGTVCEQLIALEQRRAVDAAVQRLPSLYGTVLQLRHDERRSFAEIGIRLRRSPEAARKLWCRALQCLRRDLHVYHEV